MVQARLNAAVVGCGSFAQGFHLPNLASSTSFRLAVACDRDVAVAAAAAARWSAGRAATDWREVVAAPDVDVIVLCTHTSLREELITAALERGKPVYVEKPLADNRAEMKRILHAVQRTGVPVCVGHNRRSAPAVLEFRRLLLKARAAGADRAAIIDRNTGMRSPLREEAQTQLLIRVNDDIRTWKGWIFDDDHGIMLAEMVHFIDIALWLAGSDPVEVYAKGSPRGNFSQIIAFQDGSLATLQHTLVGNFDHPKELYEATARNVSIVLDHHLEVRQRGLDDEPACTCYPLETGGGLAGNPGIAGFHEACDRLQALRRRGAPLPCPYVWPDKGHRHQLEAFARHIRGEGPNPCPVEGAILVTQVALRLCESVRSGLPVRILPEDVDPARADWAALAAVRS